MKLSFWSDIVALPLKSEFVSIYSPDVNLDEALRDFLGHVVGRIGIFDYQQGTLDPQSVGFNLKKNNI